VSLIPDDEDAGGGVGEVVGVKDATEAFPMAVEHEEELIAAEGAVVVGESEATEKLEIVAEALIDPGPADENHREVGSVVAVAEELKRDGGETFGFVDDQQFH
jgi:hypothetical protein